MKLGTCFLVLIAIVNISFFLTLYKWVYHRTPIQSSSYERKLESQHHIIADMDFCSVDDILTLGPLESDIDLLTVLQSKRQDLYRRGLIRAGRIPNIIHFVKGD